MDVAKNSKLLGVEASVRVGFRRLGHGINCSLQLYMKQPTILQMLEQGRGEDLHVAIDRTASLPSDASALENFNTVADVVAEILDSTSQVVSLNSASPYLSYGLIFGLAVWESCPIAYRLRKPADRPSSSAAAAKGSLWRFYSEAALTSLETKIAVMQR